MYLQSALFPRSGQSASLSLPLFLTLRKAIWPLQWAVGARVWMGRWILTALDYALQEWTLVSSKIHKDFSNMAQAVEIPLRYLELTACD